MGDQVLIGYSFWGFLGPGITETPDGGRSHRRVFIDGLQDRGHKAVFVQANRDYEEAGLDLTRAYLWDSELPELDVLFLEWRWPIPGRNTTACGAPGHTCDLHRQQQLLDHYTGRGTPTVLWDKDRQLPQRHPLRQAANVTVCEPALHPSPGAVSLLFPVADSALDCADPMALATRHRDLPLVYVGNQYDRDDAFDRFFAPAAAVHLHLVAGKWTRTQRWPRLNFHGRVPFTAANALHHRAVATLLLLPDRYARVAHVTQRLFEAVLAGCLPITPTAIRDAARFTPAELHVTDGHQVAQRIAELVSLAGTDHHAELIGLCLERLDLFRLSRQLDTIEQVLAGHKAHQASR
ncbi:hypothetical protein B0E53_03218 [Micromonospora sp. MH33]|uniref:hypothetical protein n=1 Tax=Micromonospora sp. MH33 TaxID=1945509 RepID=UPI000D147E85|nr:hypothetical protein [Micromonospora sp. MH33]PSK64844.1 hypothetical protein B0E53_03218 [Micromonospora sp. MH33]